ncbi:Cation-transporting P-type ATPase [Gracilaria domingensis]|nr:Cation-transporting P-type ATPase [Gracilaria domingensis]
MVDIEQGSAPPRFSITPQDLVRIVEERDRDALNRLGGPSGLALALRSDPQKGLSADEISAGMLPRSQYYGANKFKYPPPKSLLRLVYEAFHDVTIIILSIAALVSLVIGSAIADNREHYGYLEGIAIVLVVCIVVMVQALIDRQKEKKFRQLNSVKDNYAVQVLRASTTTSVDAENILVGDVIKISAGDKLPADAILLRGSALKTNESAMTGEPIDIHKTLDDDVFLLSGTTVSEGVGYALVVAVGERSQWGVILKGLIVEPENTPLQERLDRLAWSIGKLGILFAVLTFAVSFIRWIIDGATSGEWDGNEVLDFFIDAVTIVVVAIPEGLPLAITLGLAFAMRKMMKDNNLVRRLEACETMGSATQLNADKTGTLTQNRMTVVEANWFGPFAVYDETLSPAPDNVSDRYRDLLCSAMAVNSQANLQFNASGTIDHLGNKTECALLQLVNLWQKDYRAIRKESDVFRVYMFDSIKKSMSTAERLGNGVIRLHTKGAPELVVKKCSQKLQPDGYTCTALDREGRQQILSHVQAMASRGLRTLLLAYRDVDHTENDEAFWREAPDDNLTYIGVVGIKDPVRPETREAVRQLKEAGVTVRMVTGDNKLTATFIAKEAGILDPDGLVVEGPEFRAMSQAELDKKALKIQVLARSTPNDKLLLVREHKKLGEVTSVTGDGTNDGPALKEADVGFALGIAGTEIAKEACDIVILDDNIQSMTKAVLWGRNVYESIRKFLQFQLVVNVVAVTLNFISACAGRELPLGAVPLLWVNMIMDSMGALALATEPPRPDLLERKPFGRRAPLINRAMYRNIAGMSFFQLLVCLILQYAGSEIFGLECEPTARPGEFDCTARDLEIRSIIFNVFVFMQIGSEINSRRISGKNVFAGLFHSYLFMLIVTITILVQVALMLGVGGTRVGDSIGIGRINAAAWGTSLVLGALALPWGFLVRCFPLDWCYGPTDEDPTDMSKLEKLMRVPQRKVPYDGSDHEVSDAMKESRTDETEISSNRAKEELDGVPQPSLEVSPSLVRLRVFVHAVAFVNVVSRGKMDSK